MTIYHLVGVKLLLFLMISALDSKLNRLNGILHLGDAGNIILMGHVEATHAQSQFHCVRNHEGDIVCAKEFSIPNFIVLVAEAIAIRVILGYCL